MANMSSALTTVLVVLAVAQSSVALSRWRSMAGQALVVNGTSTAVTNEGFLFCQAEVAPGVPLDHYQVSWTTASGTPLATWTPNTKTPSMLQGGRLGAYSYLLFRDFDASHGGDYICVLTYKGFHVDSSIITVQQA
ncbi:uncharacterized protein LOC123505011 [Portunus trituberculatus]|uniref:Ig-like domain-containing protein n=1 Tax=Portunus trituberculatus TaxID=210409 RepID=A0A5B7HME7_PORTR|nr:uncharacterized protein LOC123505011 [Portunus trituberculatus]MPC71363.1 hypothetical protein [Portunus trituberculatus]